MGLAMDLAELEKSKAVPGEEKEIELTWVDVLEIIWRTWEDDDEDDDDEQEE